MAPIGNNSILIAGGASFYRYGDGDEVYGQGVILNLDSMQMSQVFDEASPNLFFMHSGNQVVLNNAEQAGIHDGN